MIGNLFFVSLSLFNTVSKPSTVDNGFTTDTVFESESISDNFEIDSNETNSFYDTEIAVNDFDNGEITIKANLLIKSIEDKLNQFGTTVEKELERQKCLYKAKQFAKTKSKRNKKQENTQFDFSSTLDNMSLDYQRYKESNNNVQSPKRASSYDNSQAATILTIHTFVVGYFSAKNYNLAAELLIHMRENNEIDSIYRPVNSDVVTNSDVFKALAYKTNGETDSFEPDSSSVTKQDLYYAIHLFNYRKSLQNDAIVLTDRYDFEPNSGYLDSIQEMATEMMYRGQTMGILKPFYTVVSSINTLNVQNNVSRYISQSFSSTYEWQYKQVQLTLGYDDYVYINFKFPTSGYRTVQTLGDMDTELILYSRNDYSTVCAYNDDEGYLLNALLSYYFEANVSYSILVRFYYYEDIGNVRVVFTPSNESDYDGIKQIKRDEGFFTSEYKDVPVQNTSGRVSLFTLKPALGRNFTIETSKRDNYQDTKLYFTDPRRGDSHYEKNKDKQLRSCIIDDDGGDNYQAKMPLNGRATNIPYLIIASTYSSTLSANFNLKISGLNSSIFDNLLIF